MFRMNRNPQEEIEEIEEEAAANYVNAPACTVEKMAARPDQRFHCFSQSFLLIAVCWLILLVIMGLRIYFTKRNLNDKLSVLENPITNLTAVYQKLETRNQELETQNQELETQNQELETQNLELETQSQELETQNQELETRNQELETRNQEMETRNQELETQNQELETRNQEINNLRGPIQNIRQAQWIIDEYCPKENNERRCRACQKGWELIQSSCYLFYKTDQKTWEEAREDCTARSSDLVVIQSQGEQNVLSFYSGYWVGVRAEGGRWKWINGRDLTESNGGWINEQPNATDGQCVVYDVFKWRYGWRSENCAERNRWICKKKVLSV
ncbi:C-type lectin domain family 10 member A-like [Perca flavescens]|uniref:C-type lectin domain family 10 member A-like n=1 Tax=Perca flavescens TaxID=8167 RepID=UPI00106E509A|nr:C-type lectin domain family 10 member A-like [Perca flavescens]